MLSSIAKRRHVLQSSLLIILGLIIISPLLSVLIINKTSTNPNDIIVKIASVPIISFILSYIIGTSYIILTNTDEDDKLIIDINDLAKKYWHVYIFLKIQGFLFLAMLSTIFSMTVTINIKHNNTTLWIVSYVYVGIFWIIICIFMFVGIFFLIKRLTTKQAVILPAPSPVIPIDIV